MVARHGHYSVNSMNKNLRNIVAAGFAILAIIGAAFWFVNSQNNFSQNASIVDFGERNKESLGSHVIIEGTLIPVELAKTNVEVQKGLSGRLSLDPERGMLFIFFKPDYYRFWMPDMHFPIDIIWIDKDKKIIGIDKKVSPKFDPANPRFYVSPGFAQFVLEVNAGFSDAYGFTIGDRVTFVNISY